MVNKHRENGYFIWKISVFGFSFVCFSGLKSTGLSWKQMIEFASVGIEQNLNENVIISGAAEFSSV